jgi:hypothetical protein
MRQGHAKQILKIASVGLFVLGASTVASDPASAQTKTGGITVTTTTPPAHTPPPAVIHVQPKQPDQPKPQIKLYYQPAVPEIPEIPADPRGARETTTVGSGNPGGGTGNLGQLTSVSSIGQLLALPAADEARGPSQVLHKLENRLPLAGAAGQSAGNPGTADGRSGALKALEDAKPIL